MVQRRCSSPDGCRFGEIYGSRVLNLWTCCGGIKVSEVFARVIRALETSKSQSSNTLPDVLCVCVFVFVFVAILSASQLFKV